MRGEDKQNHTLFSYVRPDSRIPANHPLRLIRQVTDTALRSLSDEFPRNDGKDEPPSAGRNGERDFHREKRSNKTHASTTDPDARLYKKGKGKEAKLSFIGHLLMENRNGLIVMPD